MDRIDVSLLFTVSSVLQQRTPSVLALSMIEMCLSEKCLLRTFFFAYDVF